MSQKRQPEDSRSRSDGGSPDDKRRKIPNLKEVVQEIMKIQTVHHLLEPILEPLIRRVVKEEVELALRKHLNNMKQNCGKDVNPFDSRSLQLQFLNNLSLPVFTGARIEGEDCCSVKVALVDALTGNIVNSGHGSSARVEIVVLEGDFDGDVGTNWTFEEFKNNIVREREGKKALLTGDVFLTLKEGIGLVGEISFTDNSSWTRSRRFRLGARVVDNCDGRIREAMTEPFIVRDHRGELYKKHYPPSLFDEVWRLEKIGKDGAFHKRLSRENIHTVKDFLTQLILDPSRLRNILGSGMSAKMWEATVEHARTCVLDKRVFLYYLPSSQPKTGVVFNVVGQVMGLLSEHQYVPVHKLSETEKVDTQNMVISAYGHWEEVVSFEDEASLTGNSVSLTDVQYNISSPRPEGSNGGQVLASNGIGGFDYAQPSVPSPDIISSIYSIGDMSGLDDYALHGVDDMGLRDDHTLSYPGQVTDSLICDTGSITHNFCDEDHLQFFDIDSSIQSQNISFASPADLRCAVEGFLYTRSTTVKVAQSRWTKLFSVLKFLSIRKAVRTRGRQIQRYGHAC